jgi:hypothetical protein
MLSHDDSVYVCDRRNDRIQVFKPGGSFVKKAFSEPATLVPDRRGTSFGRDTAALAGLWRTPGPWVCFVNVHSVDRILYSIFQRLN